MEFVGRMLLGVHWETFNFQWESKLVDTPLISFGVFTLAITVTAYISTAAILEMLIRMPFMKSSLITYTKKPRLKCAAESQEKYDAAVISKSKDNNAKPDVDKIQRLTLFYQFCIAISMFLGPGGLFNGVVNALLCGYFDLMAASRVNTTTAFDPTNNGFNSHNWWHGHLFTNWAFPHAQFIMQFVLLALVADFGLYWGHRIQHESSWLWENCHYRHHQLDTPTPIGTPSLSHVIHSLRSTYNIQVVI